MSNTSCVGVATLLMSGLVRSSYMLGKWFSICPPGIWRGVHFTVSTFHNIETITSHGKIA